MKTGILLIVLKNELWVQIDFLTLVFKNDFSKVDTKWHGCPLPNYHTEKEIIKDIEKWNPHLSHSMSLGGFFFWFKNVNTFHDVWFIAILMLSL